MTVSSPSLKERRKTKDRCGKPIPCIFDLMAAKLQRDFFLSHTLAYQCCSLILPSALHKACWKAFTLTMSFQLFHQPLHQIDELGRPPSSLSANRPEWGGINRRWRGGDLDRRRCCRSCRCRNQFRCLVYHRGRQRCTRFALPTIGPCQRGQQVGCLR